VAKPGVSAARFLHLDSYNGWGFADRKGEVEPDHIPGVVVGGEGLVLPRGGLPAGDVPEHVTARVRPRGLAFDRLQRPYAVQDDRRGFCLLAGCARPPPE